MPRMELRCTVTEQLGLTPRDPCSTPMVSPRGKERAGTGRGQGQGEGTLLHRPVSNAHERLLSCPKQMNSLE